MLLLSPMHEEVAPVHVHVTLNRREERLQPFIRGGVRKITDEDLRV